MSDHEPLTPHRRPGRSQARLVAPLVAVLLAALVLLHPADAMQSVRRLVGLAPERPMPAPMVVDAGGVFAFAMTQPGSSEPVGWDPCEPIEYSVNPAGEPEGGRSLIENALDRASAASGLVFENAGDTDRRPSMGALVPLVKRPVVIGWADPQEFPELAGPVAGLGGGSAENAAGGHHYLVSGAVVLDTDAFTPAAIATSTEVMEAVVLHEVAHLIGLAHVNEPLELMYEASTGRAELGPGDLEGLARLGSVPCR